MTCKRSKIVSDPENTYSGFYNYAFLPLLVVYLCIPIVSLIKYIYTDIVKAYYIDPRVDLKQCGGYDTEELIKLKVENALLKEQIQRRKYTRDMLNVLKNYEYTLQRFMREHKNVLAQRDDLQEILNALEDNYHVLSLKYDKAKEIIDGLEKNEQSLQQHLLKWEETVQNIEQKYECFKEYAVDKIDSANHQIKTTDTEYKHEICKLKTKVIEGQIRINELETHLSTMSLKGSKCRTPNHIFEPLVTKIN